MAISFFDWFSEGEQGRGMWEEKENGMCYYYHKILDWTPHTFELLRSSLSSSTSIAIQRSPPLPLVPPNTRTTYQAPLQYQPDQPMGFFSHASSWNGRVEEWFVMLFLVYVLRFL